MTKDEQKTEIGSMVIEKKELERQLACVNNKLHRFKIVFEKSIEAINGVVNWKCSGEGEEMCVKFPIGDESLPHVFPSNSEFAGALKKRWELGERIEELGCILDQL